MLKECDQNFLASMDENDRIDLNARFVANVLRINFKPRVFLPTQTVS
jgi:hypothetical protein